MMRSARALALGLACLACGCHTRRKPRSLQLPAVMVWAWERSEDLAFVDAHRTGVAFLAGTAVIRTNGSVVFRWRTQALKLAPGVAVLPVVRIESPPVHAPVRAEPLLAALQGVANQPGVRGLQIDFDARRSERAFYRALLAGLQQRTSAAISITALASWCEGDRWLDGQPVDEAVPMFFRMGRGESRDMRVKSGVCRAAIGLSTDEPWPIQRATGTQRIYLFNPRAWTPEEYNRAMRRLEDWK